MKKLFTVFISIFLIILTLTACGRTDISDEVIIPGSVTIETFMKTTFSEESASESDVPYYISVPAESQSLPYTPAETESSVPDVLSRPAQSSESDYAETTDDLYSISECSMVMYASSSVNIRQKPDADSKRLGHLDKGEKVRVSGIVSNGWYRIVVDDEECFVNGRYLTDTPPEDTEPVKTTVTTAAKPPKTTVTATEPFITTVEPTTPESVTTTEEDIDISEIGDIVPQPIGYRNYNALNYDVQKAVWFAFLDLNPMLSDATAESFTDSIRTAFKNVSEMGCNTVYVHVRSHGDAYYFSDYYPFTAAYSGTAGIAPDFDPLEIMITEAHRLGLSFHAWVNPMRTTNKERFNEISDGYAIKQWYNSDSANGKYLVYEKDDGFYWLSPAYTAVRELICNGIKEIVSRYDVDGIHIDDYFYPTTDKAFDKAAFSVSGWSDLGEWRREMVSALVSEMYSSVKSCNRTVMFGVSPQGNRDNNRNKLYADIERWCSGSGYLDYIVPQIYYGYSGKLPFDSTASEWQSVVTNQDIKLVCGIAAYKVGTTTEWKSGDMLSMQTSYIDSLDRYSGCAYYRYESIFSSDSYMKKEYKKLIKAIAALN